jgi:hypothetical protein
MPPPALQGASFSDAAQAERVLLHAFVRGADQWPIEGRRQDGEVWFQDLPLGRYEVFAGQPMPDAVQRVELTADGQVVQVQLAIPSLQSIAGRCAMSGGCRWSRPGFER